MGRVILTVCLNPAIDVTYTIPPFDLGTSITIEQIQNRAGGKGINTARALAQLGETPVVVGFAGGQTGEWLCTLLDADGLTHRLTRIAGQTRQCLTVYDGSSATVFNERGPVVSAAEWLDLVATIEEALPSASAISLSGSVPPGCPVDAYAQLISLARVFDVPSVLDAGGSQLTHALSAGATIFAPNLSETIEALGLPEAAALLDAASKLARETGAAAVVSAGEEGIVAVVGDQRWSARPRLVLRGNPTGAGDALTAALVRGLAQKKSWPEILNRAVALAGAAVVSATAGNVDVAAYRRLLIGNTVKEI